MPAIVNFWWKPGCATNTRQIHALEDAGCDVQVHDLLAEPWQPERLAGFLVGYPVRDWFNPAAPALRQGLVEPDLYDQTTALARLVAEPILIRRPLIEVAGRRSAGFDASWLREQGIVISDRPLPEGCSHGDATDANCAIPESAR